MDIQKTYNGCDKRGEKKANGPREDEKTNWCKLGGMEMMGGWMEAGTHMGI
jgi:hypothetical protein